MPLSLIKVSVVCVCVCVFDRPLTAPAPAAACQVGDTISCAVYDVEAGGVPLLTQRLPEEPDDELAELAEEMDQVRGGGGGRV